MLCRRPCPHDAATPHLAGPFRLDALVSWSSQMHEIFELAAELASTRIPVLLEGEPGTGKESLARAMHRRGPRRGGRFVTIDHVEASEADLAGRIDRAIALAEGGTLYVREAAALPAFVLSDLLRRVDDLDRGVRCEAPGRRSLGLVAATSFGVGAESPASAALDSFSRRLAWVPIRLPPLRDRRDDIALLAAHFLARAAFRDRRPLLNLGDSARAALEARPFPGNVAELERLVERAARLAAGPTLLATHVVEADALARAVAPSPGF